MDHSNGGRLGWCRVVDRAMKTNGTSDRGWRRTTGLEAQGAKVKLQGRQRRSWLTAQGPVLPYNASVADDDSRGPDAGAQPPSETAAQRHETPAPAESEGVTVPILRSSTRDRSWQGGGGLSRWATLGCGAAVVVLVALLAVGVGLTRRTAWMAFDRSQQRLMAAVEQRNQPAERLRTSRNIERFKAQLRVARDPYPLMGEFMKRVQEDLGDGTLDAAEVEEFNRFLESHLPSAAMTP